MPKLTTAVVIPSWNGKDSLGACLDSLLAQSQPTDIVVVDNGSQDGSVEFIKAGYPTVHLIELARNQGFAGGVNAGLRYALAEDYHYIALFNNDAVADENWLEALVEAITVSAHVGIVTGKLLQMDRQHLDSTGECFTSWGLPYARGRGEVDTGQYDKLTTVFGASGGASLYSSVMLQQIGLFDESFFAYYEDVDLSFRAQLAGWRVSYVPVAMAYHEIGATSRQIKGFTTYQSLKNLPMVVRKNVPLGLLPTVLPRFWLAYWAFFWSAIARGQVWPAVKGLFMALLFLPKNFWQRAGIQKHRKLSNAEVRALLVYDLPPAADRLRRLRRLFTNR